MPNSTRYQLGKEIGHGAMGKVFTGTDTVAGQGVALKFLHPNLAVTETDLVARFRREGKALRQLNHPNIVKILDITEINNQQCIVMELITGGNLRELIETHAPLPVERVIDIGLEIADALVQAHHLNIIHRDIKPSNVLLTTDGKPRLADFGLVKMLEGSTLSESNTLIGTAHYTSPEPLSGQGYAVCNDIWAFGVMLFEMLSGVRPFQGENAMRLFNTILTKAPYPDLEIVRPDLPLSLVDLIYRMLEKDRYIRIPSMRLVAAELEAIRYGYSTGMSRRSGLRQPSHDDAMDGRRRPMHNLPAQTIPFVGRASELDELQSYLGDPSMRLITIFGAGGMGKTRLALELGRTQIEAYTDGVFFVPLAAVNDPQNITTAVADGAGFKFYEGIEPRQQLLNFLRRKHLLLIVDNFEHLLDGAELVSEILSIAPDVKVLVTSREKLKLSGEQVYSISGMDIPAESSPDLGLDYDAAKLFIQRAKRVDPHFYVEHRDYDLLRRLCQLVGGMPLGLVLAAGWADQLTLEEIADELGTNLLLLETDTRDIPARHRNMQAVFEHSWKLLTDEEQDCFPKLAVFQGGFTRDAAVAVAGTTLRTLTGLVNKSLVQRDRETGRYALHELMRQFAREILRDRGEEEMAFETHGFYYTDYAYQLGEQIKGARQKPVFEALIADEENIHAALMWAAEQRQILRIQRCLFAVEVTIFFQAHFESMQFFSAIGDRLASKLDEGDPDSVATYAYVRTLQTNWSNNYEEKIEGIRYAWNQLSRHVAWEENNWLNCVLLFEAIDLKIITGEEAKLQRQTRIAISRRAGDKFLLAWCLFWMSVTEDDPEEVILMLEEGLRLVEAIDDLWWRGYVLQNLASSITWQRGDLAQGQRLFKRTQQSAYNIGDTNIFLRSTWRLVGIQIVLGDFSTAEKSYLEFLNVASDVGALNYIMGGYADLGDIYRYQGAYIKAGKHYEIALSIARDTQGTLDKRWIYHSLADLALIQDDFAGACQFLEQSQTAFENENDEWRTAAIQRVEGRIAFQTDDFQTAHADFRQALDFYEDRNQVFSVVQIQALLGRTQTALGNLDEARQLLTTAIQRTVQMGAMPYALFSLLFFAELLARTSELENATIIAAHVDNHVSTWHEYKVEARQLLSKLESELSPDEYTAAVKHGKSSDTTTIITDIANIELPSS